MKRVSILGILFTIGCGIHIPPNPNPTPTPTPTPEPECLVGVPWCHELTPPATCSVPDKMCKHNPTSDPKHCEFAPPCPEPEIPPTPVDPCDGITCDPGYSCKAGNCVKDTTTPPPTGGICPKDLAPGAYVYLNDKPYGQGFDSTYRIHGDPEFCKIISGIASNDCHLEGWPNKVACELKLGGGCPIWQFTTDNGMAVQPCHDNQGALASCDHFGDPTYRDDPKTPTSGNTLETLTGFEGFPKECGLQRNSFGPIAGYFTIAHGIGKVRACKPDGNNCGPWRAFNH